MMMGIFVLIGYCHYFGFGFLALIWKLLWKKKKKDGDQFSLAKEESPVSKWP